MASFDEVAYQCKKLITRTSLASELNVLAHALNQLSEGHRRSRDFTLNSLREVLGEVVACFPVYRTYVNTDGWTQSDRRVIETAVRRARKRNPALEPSAWDFLREVLLPRSANEPGRDEADNGTERRVSYPPPDPDEYHERLHFAMRFQQYTAPVQAKGVEDTAFYRYNLLLSLNEVGGDPGRFGRSPAEFHESNLARLRQWPLEMTATATHDTKLGEDVRARINVLSELVDDWRRGLARWMRINAGNRTKVDAEPAPDRNDEYRFYHVLVGTWPADAFGALVPSAPDVTYVQRIRDYMIKAIKEAKLRTSWINDNEAYDRAVAHFVDRTLTGPSAPRFLNVFLPFACRVAHLGMINSLSQLALKIVAPGVPDFYQGTELWDLHLVDPDNRQPIDYEQRIRLLDGLRPWLDDDVPSQSVGRDFSPANPVRPADAAGPADPRSPDSASVSPRLAAVRDMLACWPDGRIKMFLTVIGLRLRRANPDLFLRGDYLPLQPDMAGVAGDVVSFARRFNGEALIVAVPRLIAKLVNLELPVGEVWGEARLVLPADLAGRYRNLLTGEDVETTGGDRGAALALSDAFRYAPVAMLRLEA
jgi:(1->4)-alpha-D-glucan 1-alpha-D-glucosylmutase